MRYSIFKLFLILFIYFLFIGQIYSDSILIASYSTNANHRPAILKNFALAVESIDGYIISPKGEFSFARVVGEPSISKGYELGRVLYGDMEFYETGGGLCQVSTTLFNTFILAGFQVKKRFRHSYPVRYVPLGLDATISYGSKDMRVINPYQQYFIVRASLKDGKLVMSLYSDFKIPDYFEIHTQIDSDSIDNISESSGYKGKTVYVYRTRYSPTSKLETKLLYKDYYPPSFFRKRN